MINELTKQERICLLHMLYLAETVDGVLDSREEELLKVYADKLGLRCNQEDLKKFKNLSLPDELEIIKTYEQRKKKILFSEIVAVMFSDGIYDDKEKAFIQIMKIIPRKNLVKYRFFLNNLVFRCWDFELIQKRHTFGDRFLI